MNEDKTASRGTQSRSSRSSSAAIWGARISFALVFLMNIQCALQFIIDPASFIASYELAGVPGEAAVRGFGILFLMCNVTYPLFIVQPIRFQILGPLIIAQQLIGTVGESFIFLSLDPAHAVLSSAIGRFMAFDIAGLALLCASYLILRNACGPCSFRSPATRADDLR